MLKFEVAGFQFKDHQLRKQKFHISTPINLTYQFNDDAPYSIQGSSGFESEWAAGHLLRTGKIAAASDIQSIGRKETGVMIEGTLSSPPPIVLPPIKLTAYELLNLTASFQEKSILYKDTGTAHTGAYANSKALIVAMNDIYRMNVLDKICGSIVLKGPHSPILLTSGKICDITVSVAHHLGVQVIISRSAPLWNACQLAEKTGQTLVGFARGPKFSIFGKNHHIVIN